MPAGPPTPRFNAPCTALTGSTPSRRVRDPATLEHLDSRQKGKRCRSTRSTATPSASGSAGHAVPQLLHRQLPRRRRSPSGCSRAFPSFEEAAKVGRTFSAVNEKGKVQVTDSTHVRRADRRAEPGPGRARVPRPALLRLRHPQPPRPTTSSSAAASTRPARAATSTSTSTSTTSSDRAAPPPAEHPDLLQQGLEAGVGRQHRALGQGRQGLPPLVLADLQPLRGLRDQRDQLPRRDGGEVPRGPGPQVVRGLLLHQGGPGRTGPARRTRRSSRPAPTRSSRGACMMPLERAGHAVRAARCRGAQEEDQELTRRSARRPGRDPANRS